MPPCSKLELPVVTRVESSRPWMSLVCRIWILSAGSGARAATDGVDRSADGDGDGKTPGDVHALRTSRRRLARMTILLRTITTDE
jgi:hypothetical protein